MGRVHKVDILSEVNDWPAPSSDGQMSREHSRETIDRPLVIGAGPGGLSAAWALKRAGLSPVIVERTDEVCSSWRGHYRNLRLNSPRRISSLPGARMERRLGRWGGARGLHQLRRALCRGHPARHQVRGESDQIAPRWRSLEVGDLAGRDAGALGSSRDRAAMHSPPSAMARHRGLSRRAAARGELRGAERIPRTRRADRGPWCEWHGYSSQASPQWSAARIYLCAHLAVDISTTSFDGRDVTADQARVAARLFGRSAQSAVARAAVGRSFTLRLEPPERGNGDEPQHAWPRCDDGSRLDRRFEVRTDRRVPAVERFHPDGVELADGTLAAPDVVIAATGQRPDLDGLVGHLDILGPQGGRPAVHGAQTSARLPGFISSAIACPPGSSPTWLSTHVRSLVGSHESRRLGPHYRQTGLCHSRLQLRLRQLHVRYRQAESLSHMPSSAISGSIDGVEKSLP